MIIDPNNFARIRKSDGKRVWVPCEFDISLNGQMAELAGGDRAHWMDFSTINSITTPILTASLPLLAKLTKPYLLLEGQRLQVVVHAQSIAVSNNEDDEDVQKYIGLWRVHGEYEHVVAVILFYYDVDSMVGGDIEFLDRRPLGILGYENTDLHNTGHKSGSLQQVLRPSTEEAARGIPNCTVSISTGKMIVFSNYQMAHRVLRMVNTSQHRIANRKCVALFVLDPSSDRLVPARSHLARSYWHQRSLTGRCDLLKQGDGGDGGHLPENAATLILEYMGVVFSMEERQWMRNEMLRSQLVPKSHLGVSESLLCNTGNDGVAMIGWIDNLLKKHDTQNHRNPDIRFDKTKSRINALNMPPSTVGRGLSETLSTSSDDLNFDDFLDTIEDLKDSAGN
eukprot:scaffold74699_cov49-Attheya_sp.AAC.2